MSKAGMTTIQLRANGLDRRVRVGIIGSERNAAIGAIHEFGAPAAGIPERSFLRDALVTDRRGLAQMQRKLTAAVLAGRMTGAQAAAALGAWAVARVKNRIVDGLSPALQPETVERKGSSTPLVDTGQLLGAITSVVE